MNMKNTKAIFLIVVGAFIMATGFAFAKNVSYGQLEDAARSIQIPAPVVTAPGATKESILNETTTKSANTLKEAPPVPGATVAKAEEKPTLGKKVKKWLGSNFSKIVSAVAIGFIAFLVLGTGGAALAVGAAAFGFFMLMSKL